MVKFNFADKNGESETLGQIMGAVTVMKSIGLLLNQIMD
jgi:hypothetical protein